MYLIYKNIFLKISCKSKFNAVNLLKIGIKSLKLFFSTQKKISLPHNSSCIFRFWCFDKANFIRTNAF